MRLIKISLFLFVGISAGGLFFYAIENDLMRYAYAAVAFMVIAGLVVIIVRLKKEISVLEGGKESTEVGFVVDTFQDLVGKLKEDEKELSELKDYAEEKARSIEAYNENILQSVPSGVVSIDNSMKIKSLNHAAENILGLKSEDILGMGFDEVFKGPLAELKNGDKTVSRVECRYVAPDKRSVWLGVTTSQLKNTEGRKIGLIFVFTDLTDIKKLQAKIELKQRLSQLGEMSAGISHELRNSMSVISGYARLLVKKADPSLKPTVDAISSEIAGMDRIISQMLSFARPADLNIEKVGLNKMLGEIVEQLAGRNKNIEISVSAEDSFSIQADEVLTRQALQNVIINAMDAMPDGGRIDVSIAGTPDRVQVRIKDSGPGIPEDVREKIFLPFFTTRDEGVGLGLALVQKIVVSHGGSIEVESSGDSGTVFIISLPG